MSRDADEAANGCRKCVWRQVWIGSETDAKRLCVLMLRRLILALVKEGQNKRSLFQARDVQAELIGAVEVQWFLH